VSDPITDPQAIKFCDSRIRPGSDRLAQAYAMCKQILADWNGKNLAALIPNDAGAVVQDSSVTGHDGRTPITGADVTAILGLCTTLVGLAEANADANLNQIVKVAVNPSVSF